MHHFGHPDYPQQFPGKASNSDEHPVDELFFFAFRWKNKTGGSCFTANTFIR